VTFQIAKIFHQEMDEGNAQVEGAFSLRKKTDLCLREEKR
jgi:hypothetical protein